MNKLIIIVLLLLALPCYATIFYVSEDGNNANDGSSWVLAKLTVNDVFSDYSCDGDTVVCAGTLAGIIIPNEEGTVTIMDSLSFTDGFTRGVTDTTKLWSATIPTFSSNLNTFRIIGINFIKTGNYCVDLTNRRTYGSYFEQCRFISQNSAEELVKCGFTTQSDSLCFYNCLFISITNYSTYSVQKGSTVYNSKLVLRNCTFYGDVSQMIRNSGIASDMIVENCIAYTYRAGGDLAFISSPKGGVHNWNNNIYYTNGTPEWSWNSATINTFSVWQDSLQAYDPTNETNTLYEDPLLQFKSTTCVPASGSPAIDIGATYSPLGDDAGWFQQSGFLPSSNAQIIIVE